MKFSALTITILLLSSCGRSPESYQEEIDELNCQVEDLQSKFDNIAGIASDGESQASYAQNEDYYTMNDALYECQSKFEEIESETSY